MWPVLIVCSGAFSVIAFAISLRAFSSSARAAAAVLELQARWTQLLRDLKESRSNSSSESLNERFSAIEETLAALANRVKMQRVRNAVDHATGGEANRMPDPYKDPDAWRAAVNAKLSRGKFGL